MRPERLPLFPLNVVLLPGEDLPLHIFEPRYRRMVRDCLDGGSPFGMLLALENGVVRVGCTAKIIEVVKRYAGGRMDILTRGQLPFRVVQLFSDEPLLEAQVDYLEDREELANSATKQKLIEVFEVCYTLLFHDYPKNLDDDAMEHLSYRVAETLPVDLLLKQQLLELRTETERQERVLAYLREWAPHLQKTQALRQSASGNGHGCN